jgi:hypothetical protein
MVVVGVPLYGFKAVSPLSRGTLASVSGLASISRVSGELCLAERRRNARAPRAGPAQPRGAGGLARARMRGAQAKPRHESDELT